MRTAALSRDAMLLLRALSGPWADRFIGEVLLPQIASPIGLENAHLASIRERLTDPYHCLEVLFHHYAFARRGGDRVELSRLALEALHRTCTHEQIRFFLSASDASTLWESFCEVCEEHRHRPMDQLNKGLIIGLAELAQEIYRSDRTGSIVKWLIEGISESGHLEPQFMRLTDIAGVGPKLASTLIRDMVLLHHLEDEIDLGERIYLHPVDKWIRQLVPMISPDVSHDSADWIIAGKLARCTRRAGVSGIRFNMGASFFGVRAVRIPEALDDRITDLLGRPMQVAC